jgi:hypothetical protein
MEMASRMVDRRIERYRDRVVSTRCRFVNGEVE